MITLIFYVVTFILAAISITTAVSMIFTLPFALIFKHNFPSMQSINGFFITWLLIDFLWVKFEGKHIPILLLVGIIGILFFQGKKGNHTSEGLNLLFSEIWAIILLCIYISIFGFRLY
jgi:hypothetical protein